MTKPSSEKARYFRINLPKTGNFSYIPFLKLVLLTILANLILIILIVIFKNRIPPQVPLFYGLPRGDKELSTNIGLVIPSAISIAITGFSSTLLSLITTIKIIFLIGVF
jgi:hypothetical protein